ncbi:MAG: tetratricopeptide repeat protein, partial [Phycisphaerae bacterium]
ENASRVAPADQLGEALGVLAAAYRGEGQLTKAAETAERAVKQAPDSTDALAIQVSIQLDLRQYDRAMENAAKLESLARQKLAENPTNVKLINGLQEAYIIQIQTLQDAHLALYRRDARGVPTDRLVAGKEAEAGAILSLLSDVMTKQLEIRRLMGLYEILPIAERITAYTPNDANAHVRLGFLCMHTSQIERAVAAFQRALEIQPDHPEALEMLRRFNAPTTRPAQAAATP